jgi:hypothetical protein
MSVVYKQIKVRASKGQGVQGDPPVPVRMLALQLEEAAPEYLFYSEEASSADVHVLLAQAAAAKINNVQSTYSFNPSAGTGLLTDHVIDPVDPSAWTPLDSSFGIVYPVVAPNNGTVYYMGFSVS